MTTKILKHFSVVQLATLVTGCGGKARTVAEASKGRTIRWKDYPSVGSGEALESSFTGTKVDVRGLRGKDRSYERQAM